MNLTVMIFICLRECPQYFGISLSPTFLPEIPLLCEKIPSLLLIYWNYYCLLKRGFLMLQECHCQRPDLAIRTRNSLVHKTTSRGVQRYCLHISSKLQFLLQQTFKLNAFGFDTHSSSIYCRIGVLGKLQSYSYYATSKIGCGPLINY